MIPALLLTIESLETHPLVLRIISALLILLAGFIAGRLLALMLRRILHQFNVDRSLSSTIGYRLSLERQLSTLLSVIIYAVAIIIALDALGVLKHATIIIGGALALFILVTLFLAAKDAVPNLLAGISTTYRKAGKPGDKLRIRGIQGVIIKKGPLITIVKEGEDEIRIPNRLFTKENYEILKKGAKKK